MIASEDLPDAGALEALEIAMYEDLYRAVPSVVSTSLGVEAHRSGTRLRLSAHGIDHPFFNRVMGAGVDQPPEEDLMDAAHHFRGLGVRRWMLQLHPDLAGAGFRAACRTHGVVPLRGWAKHVGSTTLRPAARSDVTVVQIAAGRSPSTGSEPGSGIRDWAGIVVQTFGMHPGCRPWFEALANRGGWHLYLAVDRGRPVASAALYAPLDGEPDGIGQLNWAGTLPEARGRGAQSALVARRVADARALGLRWIATETDEDLPDRPNPSYRNLVRLGLPVQYVRGNWGPPPPD